MFFANAELMNCYFNVGHLEHHYLAIHLFHPRECNSPPSPAKKTTGWLLFRATSLSYTLKDNFQPLTQTTISNSPLLPL